MFTKSISALIILTFICSGNVYPLEGKDTLRKPIGSDALTRAAKAADAASPVFTSGETLNSIQVSAGKAVEPLSIMYGRKSPFKMNADAILRSTNRDAKLLKEFLEYMASSVDIDMKNWIEGRTIVFQSGFHTIYLDTKLYGHAAVDFLQDIAANKKDLNQSLLELTLLYSGIISDTARRDFLKVAGTERTRKIINLLQVNGGAQGPALASGQTIGGIAEGVMTAAEHVMMNKFLLNAKALNEDKRNIDLEIAFGVRGHIRIQIVPNMFEKTGFRSHAAIRDGIVYIDQDTIISEAGMTYLRREISWLRHMYRAADALYKSRVGVDADPKTPQAPRQLLVEWLDSSGTPEEVSWLLSRVNELAEELSHGDSWMPAQQDIQHPILGTISRLRYLAKSSDAIGLTIYRNGDVKFTPVKDSEYAIDRARAAAEADEKGWVRMFRADNTDPAGKSSEEIRVGSGLWLEKMLQDRRDINEISIPQNASVEQIRDILLNVFKNDRPVRGAVRMSPARAATTGL